MNIDRLKELREETVQYRAVADGRCMSTSYEDDLLTLIDAAIARQSVNNEEVQEAIEILRMNSELEKVIDENGDIDNQPYLNALDLAITALQEYQPWISVEDSLPDGDIASVLIYTNKGGVSEGQYYLCIKSWKQFRWSVENADVTHWKPLPEAPKGE